MLRVSELLLHVDDRLALLQQQRRERMPQVVDADLPELRFLEHPREHVPDVALLERGRPRSDGKTHGGRSLPFFSQRSR